MHPSQLLLYPCIVLLTLGFAFYRRLSVATQLVGTYFLFPARPVPTVNPFDLDALVSDHSRGTSSRIPRTLHHVLLGQNYTMRPDWLVATQACERLHPDWETKLWTDKEGDALVKRAYGEEMFRLYRSYDQEIMRANVLRYMIIHEEGGVFLDLDIACQTSLEPLRQAMEAQDALLTPQAQPTGVNNAFIMAAPNHPFLSQLISRLPYFKMGWFGSAYITNMFSTGCHFFSTAHLAFQDRQQRLRVLPWDYKLNGHVKNDLFEHLGASSWHKQDARIILGLGKSVEAVRPYLSALAWTAVLVFVIFTVAVVRRMVHHRRRRRVQQSQHAWSGLDVKEV